MSIVVLDSDQFRECLQELKRDLLLGLSSANPPEQNDRIGLEEAINLTGYSKSQLYKLSMKGLIPVKKFGRKLIFSRSDLKAWMEKNSIPVKSKESVVAEKLASLNKIKSFKK